MFPGPSSPIDRSKDELNGFQDRGLPRIIWTDVRSGRSDRDLGVVEAAVVVELVWSSSSTVPAPVLADRSEGLRIQIEHHARSGHIARSRTTGTASPASPRTRPARIRDTRARTSARAASSCSSVRVVDSRSADSVKYSVTRSGVPEAQRVAAGERVDRQLEALVDALLARGAGRSCSR